jgi:hypothetical protein
VTADAVREAVGLADDETIAALLDAYLAGDAPAALDRIESLADGGRDMAQVAAQAEAEARRRLLASAAEPATARRLAVLLRTLAEAAAAGAREGRSRLAMELLAVEPGPSVGQAQPASALQPRAAQPVARPAHVAAPEPAADPPAPAASSSPPPAPKPAATAAAVPVEPLADRNVAAVRGRWAAIVDHATPALKPLLRECRPVNLDGARLTLAFPEERGFMREKARLRAGAIEALLGSVLGGTWAVDCVASNVELEPLTIQEAVAGDPADAEGQALLEGVLRITGGELVDAPEVR